VRGCAVCVRSGVGGVLQLFRMCENVKPYFSVQRNAARNSGREWLGGGARVYACGKMYARTACKRTCGPRPCHFRSRQSTASPHALWPGWVNLGAFLPACATSRPVPSKSHRRPPRGCLFAPPLYPSMATAVSLLLLLQPTRDERPLPTLAQLYPASDLPANTLEFAQNFTALKCRAEHYLPRHTTVGRWLCAPSHRCAVRYRTGNHVCV
jgi:hypothetical protein